MLRQRLLVDLVANSRARVQFSEPVHNVKGIRLVSYALAGVPGSGGTPTHPYYQLSVSVDRGGSISTHVATRESGAYDTLQEDVAMAPLIVTTQPYCAVVNTNSEMHELLSSTGEALSSLHGFEVRLRRPQASSGGIGADASSLTRAVLVFDIILADNLDILSIPPTDPFESQQGLTAADMRRHVKELQWTRRKLEQN